MSQAQMASSEDTPLAAALIVAASIYIAINYEAITERLHGLLNPSTTVHPDQYPVSVQETEDGDTVPVPDTVDPGPIYEDDEGEDINDNAYPTAVLGVVSAASVVPYATDVVSVVKTASKTEARRLEKEAAERAAKQVAEREAKEAAERAAKIAAEKQAKEAAEKAAKEAAERAAQTAAEKAAVTATKTAAKTGAKVGLAAAVKGIPIVGWALSALDVAMRSYDDGEVSVDNVVQSFQDDFDNLVAYGEAWMNDPGQTLELTGQALGDLGVEVYDTVAGALGQAGQAIGDFGASVAQGLVDVGNAVASGVSDLGNAVSNAWNSLWGH